MTQFQVVVKGRVCSVYQNCINAVADARRRGSPAAVRMLVMRGTYRSRTTLWPQVGPTISNRRYSLSTLQA